MKQLQFYKYATIGLLLLNLAMLAFFFLTKPKHHQGKGLQKDAKAILKLDDTQNATFLKLVKEQRQRISTFNNQQRELLKPYFSSLIDSTMENNQNILDKVEEVERKKIESFYQHFQEIKFILREEQMPDFEEFMNHAMRRVLSNSDKETAPN